MNLASSGIDFMHFDAMGDDLLVKLDTLRASDPLYWCTDNQLWIATDHEAVIEGFSGRLPLSAERHRIVLNFFPNEAEHEEKIGNLLRYFHHFITNTDPPGHARLRKLLMMAFSRQIAESYRHYVRETVADTLREFAGRDEIDFVDQFARRTTARVILKVIGLSPDYLPKMERWAQVINEGLSGNPDTKLMIEANVVFGEMTTEFIAEIVRRRNGGEFVPGDFLSQLMEAKDGTDSLNDDEIVAQLILVLVAGHDTTLNTMALSIAKLVDYPEVTKLLRDDSSQFEPIIMELMRLIAMSTSMMRIATEDFDWRGRQIKAGQIVVLMIAAANRDPAIFVKPEQLDVSRSQSKNVTFAPGRHFCIGHWFAKMMMSEALPAFLAKYERWDVLEDKLQFNSATSFRGLTRLRLKLYPVDDQLLTKPAIG